MKKLLVLLLMIAMVVTFAACGGGEKEPAGTEGGQTSQGEDVPDVEEPSNTSDGAAWPSNHYMDMIPEPENTVIYSEEEIDNAYYLGHRVLFEKWSIEDCRAYVEKLQELGWTTPGDGMDAVITKDTAEDFEFGAYNEDHVYVSGNVHAANSSGGLFIYNLKRDLE